MPKCGALPPNFVADPWFRLYRCGSVWEMAIVLRADAVMAIEIHVTAKATSAILNVPMRASVWTALATGSLYSSKACVNYVTDGRAHGLTQTDVIASWSFDDLVHPQWHVGIPEPT